MHKAQRRLYLHHHHHLYYCHCHSESVAGPSGIVGLDSSECNSRTGSGEESDSSITSDSVEKADSDDIYF